MPRELNLPPSWDDPPEPPKRRERAPRPKPKIMLEAKVKEIVKALLRQHHAQFYMPVPGGFGEKGAHDFLCCSKGRYFTVETKREGVSTMSVHQQAFAERVMAAGGKVFLINGSRDGLRALEAWLGEE